MSTQRTHDVPGDPVSTETDLLAKGAAMLQDLSPVKAICAYFHGIHAYAGDNKRHVGSHHYCHIVNEDIRQCVIYDGNSPNSRLIGVEYLISARLWETLAPDEKKLWHSHVLEVKSGMLIMPRPNAVPRAVWEKAELKEVEQIVGMYGKTEPSKQKLSLDGDDRYHLWQADRGDPLPLGKPELMLSFTPDSKVDVEKMLEERDEEFNVDHRRLAEMRKGIPSPDIDAESCADGNWLHD